MEGEGVEHLGQWRILNNCVVVLKHGGICRHLPLPHLEEGVVSG